MLLFKSPRSLGLKVNLSHLLASPRFLNSEFKPFSLQIIISPSSADPYQQDFPEVTFDDVEGEEGALFTVMLVDPDAPSAADPKFANWVHFVKVDVKQR
jgi:phosphatidylethanolamine-binding protein (PEBP) family uncharacterized protein